MPAVILRGKRTCNVTDYCAHLVVWEIARENKQLTRIILFDMHLATNGASCRTVCVMLCISHDVLPSALCPAPRALLRRLRTRAPNGRAVYQSLRRGLVCCGGGGNHRGRGLESHVRGKRWKELLEMFSGRSIFSRAVGWTAAAEEK